MKSSRRALLALTSATAVCGLQPWQDWTLPVEERLDDLMSRLTLNETIYQTWSIAPAIDRLNISAYNWVGNIR